MPNALIDEAGAADQEPRPAIANYQSCAGYRPDFWEALTALLGHDVPDPSHCRPVRLMRFRRNVGVIAERLRVGEGALFAPCHGHTTRCAPFALSRYNSDGIDGIQIYESMYYGAPPWFESYADHERITGIVLRLNGNCGSRQ
jgi:hypothetical protein